MKHLALTILLACVGVTNSHATNYFVSSSGNNANDGLNSTTAWASIDNGDQLAILNPGDTVLIASGTYSLTQSVTLTTFGTEAQQVVYMGYGQGEVIIDLNGDLGQTGVRIEASHVTLLNVRIINSAGGGINVNGDSCTIAYCHVDGVAFEGIRIRGHHNLLFRNIISFVGGEGIRIDDIGSLDNEIIGNTVVGASGDGIIIKLGQTTTRIFNNIVIGNDKAGIRGQIENTSGFNNVWSNSGGDYAGGAFDSAGGISADPLFEILPQVISAWKPRHPVLMLLSISVTHSTVVRPIWGRLNIYLWQTGHQYLF